MISSTYAEVMDAIVQLEQLRASVAHRPLVAASVRDAIACLYGALAMSVDADADADPELARAARDAEVRP